jgi:hypothetical protein
MALRLRTNNKPHESHSCASSAEIEEAKIHAVVVIHSLMWQRVQANTGYHRSPELGSKLTTVSQWPTQREGESTDPLTGTINYSYVVLVMRVPCTMTVVEASSLGSNTYKPTSSAKGRITSNSP